MKRVTEIKVLPVEDAFILDGMLARASKGARKNKRAKALFLAGSILFLMSMSGCGKSESAESTPAPEAPIESPYVPEATPEPAATVDPEVAKQAEEERIERLASESYAILSSNKTANYVYPYSYEDEVKQTQIAQGKFVGLPEMVAGLEPGSEAYELVKSNYLDEILLYLCEYASNIAIASINITWNGEESKLVGSQNWKKCQLEDGTYLMGADTLQLLEKLAQDVYDSYSADWATFKAKAEVFQSFVAAVFPENRNVFEGVQFTSRSRSNGLVQAYLVGVSDACLFAIANRTQKEGQVISVPENPCFTTEALINNLSEENYTVTESEGNSRCEAGSRVNEYSYRYSTDIFALMDAYIYAQSQGLEIATGPTLTLEPKA